MRTIEVVAPEEKTDRILEQLRDIPEITGIQLQRGASISPPGDVITIHGTNTGVRAAFKVLAEHDVADGGSIVTSHPSSVISLPHDDAIERESNEALWEEMGYQLRSETNMSVNYLILMAVSGGIAAVGLWTDTLYIVIAAMIVTPGFEPLLRPPFGLIANERSMIRQGVYSTAAGYGLLAVGSFLTSLVLLLVDRGAPDELDARSLVVHWTTLSATNVVLSTIAGIAGAVIMTTHHVVFASGVMIALALIPAMAIAGMALAFGDFSLALDGVGRWAVDMALVTITSIAVFWLKQAFVHKRRVFEAPESPQAGD